MSVALGVTLATSLGVSTAAGAATTSTTLPGRGSFPGTSGSVAAITGSSMEVQNAQSGQVTVNWTPSTTFSQTVDVGASTLVSGTCVTVTGTSSKGTITARSVSVSQPVSGKCAAAGTGRPGAGGGPGGFGGGASGSSRAGGRFTPPARSGAGGGRAFPGAANIAFASGQVTKVASTTLTLSGISSASLQKAAKASSKAKSSKKATPAAPKATTVKVKLASTTTFSQTQPATASNLAVGDCVSASGTASSTGAVTATTVRITSTGGQSCTAGFGGFRGGSSA
jgi:hypothetical protein